jgi:hypothetical protein
VEEDAARRITRQRLLEPGEGGARGVRRDVYAIWVGVLANVSKFDHSKISHTVCAQVVQQTIYIYNEKLYVYRVSAFYDAGFGAYMCV